MKTKIISLSFLFLLMLSSLTLVYAANFTTVTVTSDKSTYNLYDHVTLSGTAHVQRYFT